MTISRRALIAGVGAGLAAPAAFAAGETAGGARRYTILRGGAVVGSHTHDVRLDADGRVQVAIDIEMKIKVLGITAYRYEMANRETWAGGRLLRMDSATNDDGDQDYARVKPAGDMLEIDGSAHQGAVAGDAASTTYWTPAFLKRKLWINSQTGVPIAVTAARIADGGVDAPFGRIATQRWTVTGENLDITLHYANEEWVSVEFDAGGEPAQYIPDAMGPAFAPLWAASL
ncbi:DUF6134 family protein [Pikeienuella sp. HZG-20]|uniref:DUF6134 family protein n=1 Tax=Paludibacillus litoralis TaxID=3133267 RepID=UPI0030EDC829